VTLAFEDDFPGMLRVISIDAKISPPPKQTPATIEPPKPRPPKQPRPNHWHPLHQYSPEKWVPTKAKSMYIQWKAKIPNSGCDCKKKWSTLVEKNPPDYSSRMAFFSWGVDRHNDVNRELNKPILTVHEAAAIHNPLILEILNGTADPS
jgi:hypothetical protein